MQSNGILTREPFPGLLDQHGNPYAKEAARQRDYGPFVLPPVLTFSTVTGSTYRTYWMGRHDEAMKAGRAEALAMRRDAFLMALLQERKLGTTSLKWRIHVDNDRDPFQKAVKEGVTKILQQTKRFQAMRYYLLEAIWYGRYAAQCLWRWEDMKLPKPGAPDQQVPTRVMKCMMHAPVNGDKIDFRWDGTPYILIQGSQGYGANSGVPNARTILTHNGRALVLDTPNWRQRFVIHKHETLDADFFDYQAASSQHGVGIRSVLYWLNWLRNEWIANVADWCERTGLGVRLWYYQGHNPKSKEEVAEAAKAQSVNKVNILVPRFGDNPMEGVDFVETAGTGAELLQKLWQHIEDHLERFVIGQTLSSDTEGSGLGGTGVASMHAATKAKIIAYDAQNFDESFTDEFIGPMVQWTYPWVDFPVRFVSDVDQYQPQERMAGIKEMVSMGVDVAEDEVRGVMGLREPQPGERTVMQAVQQMQAQQQESQMAAQGAAAGAPGSPGVDPAAGQPPPPEAGAPAGMPQEESPPPTGYARETSAAEDKTLGVYDDILQEIEHMQREESDAKKGAEESARKAEEEAKYSRAAKAAQPEVIEEEYERDEFGLVKRRLVKRSRT